MSSDALTIAAAQVECAAGDIAVNVARHLGYIEQARARDVGLLVFPELSLTDYLTAPDLEALALPRTSDQIATLAGAAHGMAVSFGFIERDRFGACHNAQALVSDGRILHVHRKANLPAYGNLREAEYYQAGRSVQLTELSGGWRIATLVCADAWNPALPWLAALQGADVLFMPAASTLDAVAGDFDNPAGWNLVLRHTALLYGLPVVMANHCGTRGSLRFWGGSRVLDAGGKVLAQADADEALIVARIERADITKARARLPTVRDADPELVQAELGRVLSERRRS